MLEINNITNRLFGGENLEWLKQFPSESVDLVYLDPPFRSGKNYEIVDDETQEIRRFEDKDYAFGAGTMDDYIHAMSERLKELHRILKSTGSIYLHCDSHASHYLKIEMDKIFGFNNFLNEVIWNYHSGGASKRTFAKKHDILLFYGKTDSEDRIFNVIREPYKAVIAKSRKHLFHPDGKMIEDVWEIGMISTVSPERLGYPTQKPEALLNRIILTSSNKNNIVLDPFCGSGTTIAVAKNLNRNFIGIDHSPQACKVTARRLFIPQENIIILNNDFFIGEEKEINNNLIEKLKKMNGEQLQEWVCQKLEFINTGNPDKPSGADGGKDGYKIIKSKDYNGLCYLEVKSGNEVIIEPYVHKIYGVMAKDNIKRAILVGHTYSSTAYQTAKELSKNGILIKLYTIQDIINVLKSSNINGSKEALLSLIHEEYKDPQLHF